MCKVIGIDISKATFDVAYQKRNMSLAHFKFSNDIKGFKKFSKIIDEGDHCVMEASGPYYLFLSHYLYTKYLLLIHCR